MRRSEFKEILTKALIRSITERKLLWDIDFVDQYVNILMRYVDIPTKPGLEELLEKLEVSSVHGDVNLTINFN